MDPLPEAGQRMSSILYSPKVSVTIKTVRDMELHYEQRVNGYTDLQVPLPAKIKLHPFATLSCSMSRENRLSHLCHLKERHDEVERITTQINTMLMHHHPIEWH